MADLLQQLLTSPIGKQITDTLAVPTPPELRRYEPGQPLLHGRALVVGAAGGAVRGPVADLLTNAGLEVVTEDTDTSAEPAGDEQPERFGAVLVDATGIERSAELGQLHELLQPVLKRVRSSGRIIVFGRPPEDATDPHARAAQRALEGVVRSLGKEARGGTTAQLVQVGAGAENDLDAAVRFLVSARSAYVSGQVLRVGPSSSSAADLDWDRPLDGHVALVTGASRGIGAAIARVLARDGAHVVCLDVPAQGDALQRVANEIGGTSLQLDITTEDAPQRLGDHLKQRHDGVDVVVHNAGITRDKTLANMDRGWWDAVIAVNLTSQERIDDALLDDGVLNEGGRIICVSSMAGIAGGKGQSNYAGSKAGVIGHVEALAPALADRGGSINAVAPGFIETEMTGAMPLVPREFGRRMNSLSQGGLPVDVAEAIAFFASPAAVGCNGTTLRVDGQHLIGA
ncbi:3-oxoacyl-ACP reductase [Nitriliruptor alkaliphilus]|uniref:3-oxoacyl-ACP reductase n=1 Tax=Nitriliruptor alkaliphilus TaxID=427918 RepID=UPI000698D74E|nr:3-oxoacyl-ACP reductase [Nitriliruptor alkaliphilus]